MLAIAETARLTGLPIVNDKSSSIVCVSCSKVAVHEQAGHLVGAAAPGAIIGVAIGLLAVGGAKAVPSSRLGTADGAEIRLISW